MLPGHNGLEGIIVRLSQPVRIQQINEGALIFFPEYFSGVVCLHFSTHTIAGSRCEKLTQMKPTAVFISRVWEWLYYGTFHYVVGAGGGIQRG
ncbi:hypothetical protein CDAR_257861 [Caerostris darwini]|uniref:Uncharacterized protein n=1 Tax=Caerostris darwini TaxID=1538125 RepID=A0AAV4WV22_9ARAC|nr:hypothetical protein CDAR_257861 [Caerostris darwini]